MHRRKKQHGFSLMEVLMATGILAIGFVLIAMIFPAGIKLTGMAAEKTFAPVIAEEAVSILRLYGLDAAKLPSGPPATPTYSALFSPEYLNDQSLRYLFLQYLINKYGEDVVYDPISGSLPAEGTPEYQPFMDEVNARLAAESLYPSLPTKYFRQNPAQKQRYGWAALCRRNATATQQVQVRLFICRRSEGLRYYGFSYDKTSGLFAAEEIDRPLPVPVQVNPQSGNELLIVEGPVYTVRDSQYFFTEGFFIVEDRSGYTYRILRKEDQLANDGIFETLVLDSGWKSGSASTIIWVVPPAVGTGRNLCIDVMEGQF